MHGRTLTNEFGRPLFFFDNFREPIQLSLDVMVLNRPAQGDSQKIDIYRFGDKVIRPAPDGGDSRIQAAEGGNDHDRQIGIKGAYARTELQPVHALHIQIGKDNIHRFLLQANQPLCRRYVPDRHETVTSKTGFKHFAHALVVINDQNSSVHPAPSLPSILVT